MVAKMAQISTKWIKSISAQLKEVSLNERYQALYDSQTKGTAA